MFYKYQTWRLGPHVALNVQVVSESALWAVLLWLLLDFSRLLPGRHEGEQPGSDHRRRSACRPRTRRAHRLPHRQDPQQARLRKRLDDRPPLAANRPRTIPVSFCPALNWSIALESNVLCPSLTDNLNYITFFRLLEIFCKFKVKLGVTLLLHSNLAFCNSNYVSLIEEPVKPIKPNTYMACKHGW